MKKFELTYDSNGIRIRRECPERLTAQQKYRLALAGIGGATLAAMVYMVGWVALVASVGALLVYGIGMLMKD